MPGSTKAKDYDIQVERLQELRNLDSCKGKQNRVRRVYSVQVFCFLLQQGDNSNAESSLVG